MEVWKGKQEKNDQTTKHVILMEYYKKTFPDGGEMWGFMLFNAIKVVMQYQNLKCFNIKGAGYTIKP